MDYSEYKDLCRMRGRVDRKIVKAEVVVMAIVVVSLVVSLVVLRILL